MIREALAGEEGVDESGMEKLADSVSSPTSPKGHDRKGSISSSGHGRKSSSGSGRL